MNMYKKISAVAIILLCCAAMVSAKYNPEQMHKGIILGFNDANAYNADFDTKSRIGYSLGAFVKYQSSRYASFQAELLFNGKGYVQENVLVLNDTASTEPISKMSTILSYLEIPVLAKFSPVPDGKYRPYFLGGGFASILLHGTLRFETANGPFLDAGIENSKKADVGYIVGAGIDLQAGQKSWVFVEVRLEMSLISPIQNVDYKSRSIGFRGGYWF